MSFAADIGRMVIRGTFRRLTDDEMMSLLHVTMMCEESVDFQCEIYRSACNRSLAMAILDGRLRWTFGKDITFSPPAMIWLGTLADRPGNIVLLVAVLAYLKAEGREFSLDSLVNYCFSDGIPTEECYAAAWDAQKKTEQRAKDLNLPAIGPDNCLDYKEAWA